MIVLYQILEVALTAAPWLLLGLLAAGMIKGLLPESALRRWLGGSGLSPIARAAVIGAPLPLCSCGAIPTALALHRGGAGRGPTTAFLIGTPGIGVDSVAITYALLGPFMALARALGAVATALATGLLVATSPARPAAAAPAADSGCSGGSCGAGSCGAPAPGAPPAPPGVVARLRAGVVYAYTDVLDDISLWLLAGLLVAGVLMALVPPQALATYAGGPAAMLLMAVIGIPLYICATAATPIGAAMLVAGVSPGTVLVFLLAGPVTSLATLGAVRREMGSAVLVRYLVGIVVSAIALGLVADALVAAAQVDIPRQVAVAQELLPRWLQVTSLVLLVMLAVRPVRRAAGRLLPA
ncbi:SO_0444 family Cu/Zn efflux transporter [Ectothiorhodospiraceae bacterium 2226]|nr:SO_0444 family Cu/Zn efflux transporter [Ectothiorhodospiraceae bacterium 2226]